MYMRFQLEDTKPATYGIVGHQENRIRLSQFVIES
jgi:hypothetical protein